MSDYTIIANTSVDADSPIDEDLMLDLKENVEHNFEHAVRGGTFAAGVRLAIARGIISDNATTDGSGHCAPQPTTVTFSSDSVDGNPNFLTAPVVVAVLVEDTSGTAWPSTVSMIYMHNLTNISATGFTGEWKVMNFTATTNYKVFIHWIAVGFVNTGE